jgi:hemoglobin
MFGLQSFLGLEENTMSNDKKTLYERLGGYAAIAAVANDLLPRLRTDPQLGRFWAHRGEDGVTREKQLLIDFLCATTGGPMYYRGRDMVLTHRGMRISDSDWTVFLGHAAATLAKFQVPEAEQRDVVAFVQSLKKEIVE